MSTHGDKPAIIPSKAIVASIKKEYMGSNTAEHVLNLMKAGLSGIPGGGAIASLMTDYIPSRKLLRLEELVKALAEDLKTFEGQLSEQKIQTDHYAFVLEECLKGVASNPQQEKINCYKAILINAAMESSRTEMEEEYYLKLLNSLSEVNIRLLGLLYQASQIARNGPHVESYGTIQSHLQVDKDVIIGAIHELRNLNFLNTNAETMSGYINVPLDRVEGRINSSARKFIEFVTL